MKKTMMKTIGSLSAKFVAMSLALMSVGRAWGESPVAQVITDGGATTNKYESLAAAVAAVPADGTATTITMIEDEAIVGNVGVTVAAGKNITLDLNGHTISQVQPTAGTGYFIENYGTLTLKDSTDTAKDGTGTGKVTISSEHPDTSGDPTYANNLITNYGTLTIESGNFKSLTNAGYASYVVDNHSGGTANITGGKLSNTAPGAFVVRMFLSSTTAQNALNISGGVIEGAYAVWMQYSNGNANKASLNVSGGTITSTAGYAIYAYRNGGSCDASNVDVSFSGGTVRGVYLDSGSTAFKSIEVTGGNYARFSVSEANEKFVSGGTFDEAVPEEYCAEGYIPTDADPVTGKYTVKHGAYVAQILVGGYHPLTSPVAQVSDNVFISSASYYYSHSPNASTWKDANGNPFPAYVPTTDETLYYVNGDTTTEAWSAKKLFDTYYAPGKSDYGYQTSELVEFIDNSVLAKYETLADAIAAVPADGTATTITMIADETVNANAGVTIPANKNVVLDLNGKTITGVVQSATTAQTILNKGTFVITDSSDGKNGKITNVVSDENAGSPGVGKNWASNAIRNEGDLTVNSGNIINTGMGGACYAIDNYYAGKVTINGGTLDAAKAPAVRMFDNNGGKVTVTDGTIGHYTSDSDCSYMGVQVQDGSDADVDISGGTIAGMYAVYSKGTGDSSVSISGGTFDGYVGFGSAGPDDIAISDGTFLLPVVTWGEQTGFISGGIFADDVDKAYCAPGYISAVYDAQNGLYIVRQGHYVAQIVTDGGATTNKYESLAEAVAAVPTDGTETTIEMIADHSFSGNAGVEIAETQNVVLDLNGHVVSHTAPDAAESWCIYNDGKLTIKDSSDTNADGTGTGKLTTFAATVDTGNTPGYANDLILNNGEVTVMSGLLENASAAGATYVIDLDWPESDSHVKVNIDGGCISAPHSTGVRMYAFVVGDNDYTFNMTGGKIDVYGFGIHTQSSDSGVKVAVNISGGTVSSSSYMAIYDYHEKYEEPAACDNMTYNITGGTFSSASDDDDYKCSLWTYGAALNISGGVFENDVLAYTKKVDITDGEFNGLVEFYCYVSGATLDWAVSGGKFAVDADDYGLHHQLHSTGFITGGIFKLPPYDDMIAEGYFTVDNTDTETMAAYPYTVVAAILHFVYPIEGTAGVPVANEWLAAQFPSIYPDATKPIYASITNDLVQALSANGANDMPKWESYVLGLDPTDPAAKLRLTASSKNATTVTITGVIDTTKFPEPTGTTVKFRLAKRNGDEWTNLAIGSETPSFDCLLENVVGEELAIFADIVTE